VVRELLMPFVVVGGGMVGLKALAVVLPHLS
jgi:hypothetical protein